MPEVQEAIDSVRLNFNQDSLLIMNITLAFIMFGVALEIKLKHFTDLLKHPKPAIIGIISQFVLLPFLTFLLIMIIKPHPSIAMGMILVASCPGGNISNFISLMAKGNVALSVSLTAFATLAAIFMTPFNFSLWGSLYTEASNILVPIKIDPWSMVRTVLILLGLPLVLGIWFAWKFPNITARITKPIKILSLLSFLGFVIFALSANFSFFLEYIKIVLILVLAHNALAFAGGFSLAKLFGLNKKSSKSITIETGIQNSGLALVLIFNPDLFDGLGGMAIIAAWWGVWHIISGLSLATFLSWKYN